MQRNQKEGMTKKILSCGKQGFRSTKFGDPASLSMDKVVPLGYLVRCARDENQQKHKVLSISDDLNRSKYDLAQPSWKLEPGINIILH